MFRSRIWTLGVAALALAVVAMMADPAFAQRGGRGGGGGRGYGGGGRGYGGGGRGWEGGRGGWYGGWGWGGYGLGLGYGGWGGYYGGSPYYYGSDYYYPSDTTVIGSTPYYSDYQSNYYAPASYNVPANDMTATIDVRVPPNAEVSFDDQPTRQRGEMRTFSTPPLTADKVFHYNVRAKWDDNGKMVDQTRKIEVRAGRRTLVDFTRAETPPKPNPETPPKPNPETPPKPNPDEK